MKPTILIVSAVLLAGCARTTTSDFVQGSIRIVPPVSRVGSGAAMEDGGTVMFTVKDASGKTFDIYVDHRLTTKTPGAIYLLAYPADRGSIRIQNEAEFRQKVRFE